MNNHKFDISLSGSNKNIKIQYWAELVKKSLQLIQCSRRQLIHFLHSLNTKWLQHTESIVRFYHQLDIQLSAHYCNFMIYFLCIIEK